MSFDILCYFCQYAILTTISNTYCVHVFSQVECKRAQPKESVLGGTSVALMGKRILLKYDQDGLVGQIGTWIEMWMGLNMLGCM